MARHRSPRGRRAHPTPTLPLAGSTGVDGARRGPLLPVDLRALGAQALTARAAVRLIRSGAAATHGARGGRVVAGSGTVLPAGVLRGVAVAAVAAVGVTGGAVAVTGSSAPAPRLDGAVVPAPTLVAAAGPAALTLPVPGGASVPRVGVSPVVVEPPVLDPSALGRAVARAQADARRIAAQERRTASPDATADRADEESADRADEDGDADERAEAARTAERARRVGRAADPEPRSRSGACDLDTAGLGRVKPHVRDAAAFLGCAFGSPTVLGVAGRSNASDHPRGLALDFMVDRATGDRLAACAIRNREALGVSYVIWRQRIDTGDGFRPMADRGGVTANHFDHVHVSFDPGTGAGSPTAC